MFAFLPIIGPMIQALINGVTSVMNKRADVEIRRADVDLHKDSNDVEVIKARTAMLIAMKDDMGIKIARDLAMYPWLIWVALICWDKIIENQFPSLVWGVSRLPELPGFEYLPYAILAFVFGLAWRGK